MLGTLAVVLLGVVVPILPQVYWDVDPRSEQAASPLTILGPHVAVWLNVFSVLLAAAVMALHHLAGRRIAWFSTLLALGGIGVCLYHMPVHIDNLLKGSSWIGAIGLGLAGRHLAEDAKLRPYIVAALCAMVIPLTVKSLMYLWLEHPQTVSMFLENESSILKSRGWSEGSAQHVLYKRRLMFPDVTGSFGLSNVFGSIMAALSLLGAVITINVMRRWRAWAWVPALVVVGGLVCVYLTHSKGAAVALVAGVLLLGLAWAVHKTKYFKYAFSVLAVLMMVGVIALVWARGAVMGPPPASNPEGEKSLLFRYHYWQGAIRVAEDASPWVQKVGVGPGRFKQAYTQYKNPINPEEVTSTHNVFIDQIVMLGLGGIAWTLLLLIWLWRSGQLAARLQPVVPKKKSPDTTDQTTQKREINKPDHAPPTSPGSIADGTVLVALTLAVLVFGTQLLIQWEALLSPEGIGGLILGTIGFIVMMSVLSSPGWLTERAMQLGLFAAAAVLLIHAQIEMTFFHEGAVAMAMFMVGIAAAGPANTRTMPKVLTPSKPPRPSGWLWVMPLAMLAVAVQTTRLAAMPIAGHQAQMRQAAEQLRQKNYQGALDGLKQASLFIRTDPTLWRWRTVLSMEIAYAHQRRGNQRQAGQWFKLALGVLADAKKAGLDELSLMRLEAQLQERGAELLNQPGRRSLATSMWHKILLRNHHSLQDRLAYADLLWRMGRHADAAASYQQALHLSEQAYLDPAKQLSDKDAKRCNERATPRSTPAPGSAFEAQKR